MEYDFEDMPMTYGHGRRDARPPPRSANESLTLRTLQSKPARDHYRFLIWDAAYSNGLIIVAVTKTAMDEKNKR
jgi:hypothetical protein